MSASTPPNAARREVVGGVVATFVLGAILLATASWYEFGYWTETLNVETVLEMNHNGRFLVPTLDGEARIRKPPLTAWITYAFVRERTVRNMNSLDPETRRLGQEQLHTDARVPAVLLTLAALWAVFVMGRCVLGSGGGLTSFLIAATTGYVVYQGHWMTTDLPLTAFTLWLWAFVLLAVLRDRLWLGAVGAGVCGGLSLMSKGPVGLVMVVPPVLAWWGLVRLGWLPDPRLPPRRRVVVFYALAVAALLTLAIGLAWYVAVWLRYEGAWQTWTRDVLRTDPKEKDTYGPFDHLSILLMMMPWTIFLVGGVGHAWLRRRDREAGGLLLMVLGLVVPILLMSLVRDKKVRYLLPLLGPASVVTAAAVLDFVRHGLRDPAARIGLAGQWAVLFVIAAGVPLVGAWGFDKEIQRPDGLPWFSWPFAVAVAAAGVGFVSACLIWSLDRRESPRRRWAVLAAGVGVVGVGQLVYHSGASVSLKRVSEQRPLAEAIWNAVPDATVYYPFKDADGKAFEDDLSIYLDRPTYQIDRASAVPPLGDRPQVYVVLRRGRHLDDAVGSGDDDGPAPGGWRFLARTPRDFDWWYAFVRTR